jgi:transmembrane sensor
MDKKRYNPAELAHKLEQGTISPQELLWFEQWYAAFNDDEVLIHHTEYTTPEQIRDNIFDRISAQMETPKRPLAKVIGLWTGIAAAAIVLFVIGLTVLYNKSVIDPSQQVLVSTTYGQHRQVSLPDGSKVWLSPATRVSYPNHFSSTTREITLIGEAFFEVVHDVKHPFVISSGKLKTVVLGTSFNIRAYPKATSAEVTVVSGKVGVILNATKHPQQQILIANQRTIFYPATNMLLKDDYLDAAQFLDQRNGLFHFNGTSLEAIGKELQLQYGINISIATGLNSKAFYGSLNTTVPVGQSLNKLCKVMEINWTRKDGIYYLQENTN